MSRDSKAERVRRAMLELGPNARLHDIAFRTKLGNRQTASLMRQLGASMRRGKTQADGLGGCTEWTLPAAVGADS